MFVAYDVSLELIGELRVIVPAIKRVDRNLADQISRAATSISLNLAEGRFRSGGDQRRFYEIAHGSASEVRAALEVGAAWGFIDAGSRVHAIVGRLMALLWGLTRGRVIRSSDA